MTKLHLEDFFENLENFAHREIFSDLEYIWQAIPRIETYLEKFFKVLPKERIFGQVQEGAFLKGENIYIGQGTIVEPGAYIKEPSIIGPHCRVLSGAYLRGRVIVGQRCVVGHATEVKNACFLDGARAPHFNYVGDSLLGANVNLGAGSILANFRFDEKNVEFEGLDTGLKKLGAILGDNVKIGCNSVTDPGTFLYKGSWLMPNTYLPKGFYTKESLGEKLHRTR